ncbi:E3 ubiquitin-protein ligase RNF213-like isoform X8 [Mercenaria mercenaria]|uniref:E3 ubiquitin-protein ligase RNF213-like isoform X8 n=1 Tax=Mercenaria mercenaria TaxID=6596 RepID=UPI00234EC17D|nr:E3 ubiquitin-protein ligase RNF213-like isoform X8 [Mercenaria mercenaria]
MRCSRTVCGKEGDGKFCNECGDEMIDEKMDTVVICPGKFDDGSPCGADLVPVQKFCKNCGVKVDQSLFTSLQDTCPECGKVLEQEAKFCIECGHRLKKPIVGGQHSSIVREVEYSGRIEKTDCKSRMESRADSKQNDSVETNHAVLLAGTRNVIEDGNIQDGKDINTERKENKSLKDDSSGHFEKRDENIIKSGCSGSENIDKAHSEMSENYSASSVNTEAVQSTENKSHLKPEDDTEMAVNESGMSDENKTGQPEISNNLTGNISIIHETSQTDLSEQLKEVHIGKSMHRNLNIVDSTKPASNDENMKEDIGTNNDDAKGGKEDAAKGGEDGTMEVQNYRNRQDESKKQTKTEDSKVKAAQRKFNEKCFTVQFHVLTSEDFHFDPAKDKCILRIGHEELGGWNRQDRIMKEKSPAEKMLKLLQPLFEMDYLLPRSFIAAVDLADLEKVLETRAIPVEACLAYMTYMLNVTKPETCYDYGTCKFREISYAEQTVHRCIDSLLKQLQETFFSEDCVLSRWTMCYIIASHMLKRSMENKRLGTIQLCAQAFIHCIAMYDRVVAEQKTQDKEAKGHSNVLRENAKDVVRLVETYQRWHIEMEDILNVWNGVFAPVVLQSEDVGNTWNKIISEGLLQNLQRKVCKEKFIRQKFVELYCQKVDEYNRCMQECMSRAAFLAIAKEYTVDFGQFSPHEYKRFGSLISQLFISEWKKNVKTGKEEELSMLRHFLRWPPLSQYLKIYYKDQKKMEILTEDCLECLIQAISVIESKLIALLSGVLTIGEFSLIAEKDGKFPELAGLVHSKKEHTAAFVKKAIEIRQKELGAFQLLAKQMATLASVCTQLANVDMKCIDDTLKKQEHIERHQIKEFCEPADVTKVDIIETYKPRLCAFRVSPTVINIVPHLHACCESSTFMMFWNGQCQEVYNQCATLDDVVQKVWSVVKNRWDTIINRIYSGDIMFKDFEKVVGQRYRDSYDQMKVELRMMNIPERCIKERIDQLMNYRQLLEACVKGAKTILKFAQEYRLKGDFAQIRVIATHGDQDMKAFDNSVMKACEFLKDLTPDKEQCLKMFVICEPLVHWLKESMKKSGLKELKVFVDLAFMLARDEPISIARIQCLHSAVTGYAPLIFDLDESCGYKQLLNLSAVVWKELEANPKLPDKLKDTNRQLQWLKEIKKEVNSLMQAEAINANGIFTVGKNTWKKDAQSQNIDGTLMELKDTLKLTVPEQEGKRELRNYTFSQLQDLQSRLMLVTGKAEKRTDSVDRFTMIFDSITRLSSVYMKLCSSGCVLFKDWTARFFCDPEPNRPVCAVLEFGQGDGAPQLKVRRSETEDLQDIIPELANFMETCLEEWLKYINKKCKSYLHLNYFTVDQLVILQKELVKMGPDSEPSHLVYPLLSAVKDRCTPDDLLEAMAAAKEEIEGDAEIEVEEDGDSDNEEAETVEDSIEDEKKQSFVHELVQAGYEEARAIRALEFVDPEDVTAGIVWCMDHDDIEMSDEHDQSLPETLEPLREQLTQRPIFSGWSQSQTDIQTMITANIHVTGFGKQITVGSDPLISDLKALWNKFLESISSNIRDYLSLEHLGIILKYLAIKGDVLPTTLSVYMMDKDQPLPQSGEILMCTSQTTKDEVLTTIPKSSMIGIVDGCDSGYGDLKKTDCVVHGKDTEQTGSCELPCTTSCLHNADVQSEVLVKKGACGSEAVQCQIDIPTRKGTCPTNNGKATLTSSGMKSATSYDEFDQKRQFLEVEQQKLLIAKEQLELEKRKTELLEKSTILQTRSTEALESILVILREK